MLRLVVHQKDLLHPSHSIPYLLLLYSLSGNQKKMMYLSRRTSAKFLFKGM
jgi:hypothetical protein